MPDYSLFGDEHVRQYEATAGKVGHDWNGTSCLILHTIGRKSGATRKFALIYGRDGADYVLVASKGSCRAVKTANRNASRGSKSGNALADGSASTFQSALKS